MTTINFVSYSCSGTVWLWNCFIELAIRVDAEPPFTFDLDQAIDSASSRFTLRPGIEHLRTSLPSLAFKTEWVFRRDVFVRMTNHRLPPREDPPAKTVLFVRDPRDVLASIQRWEVAQHGHESDFMDYVRSNLCRWVEFHEQALSFPDVGVFRFEDYKLDPTRCLAAVLDFCGLAYGPAEIARAVDASTLEMAKRGEYEYLCSTPPEKRHYPATFNQSGRYQKWRTLADRDAAFEYVAAHANDVMGKLGYFDEAGVYRFPPRKSIAPAIRVSPAEGALDQGAPDATQIARSALHGYLAWTRQRAGALGEALKEMDLALAIDAENLPLSKLKLETLLAVIDAEPRYVEAYSGEAIRTFYSCANRDPAVLATHGLRLMRLLHRLGEKNQLSALLDDWYSYSKLVKTATPADDPEIAEVAVIFLDKEGPL